MWVSRAVVHPFVIRWRHGYRSNFVGHRYRNNRRIGNRRRKKMGNISFSEKREGDKEGNGGPRSGTEIPHVHYTYSCHSTVKIVWVNSLHTRNVKSDTKFSTKKTRKENSQVQDPFQNPCSSSQFFWEDFYFIISRVTLTLQVSMLTTRETQDQTRCNVDLSRWSVTVLFNWVWSLWNLMLNNIDHKTNVPRDRKWSPC